MSSRLAYGREGELVAVEADGTVWLVVGDTIESAGVRIWFMSEVARNTGRSPTPREQMNMRHKPARRKNGWGPQLRQPVDDDQLADEEALKLARIEQQREPADLIGRAA
jgi:hypothetical protein